jgi:hypothetical protein
MTGKLLFQNKRAVLLGIVASTLTIAVACSDNLDAGKACPVLCPEQVVALKDTMLDPVFGDTTVLGVPSIGNEVFLMLSSHGDTLDSRAIIRYDTITNTFTGASSTDSTITEVDSAELVVPIAPDDTLRRPTTPVTIEAYDVDTAATDTVASILATLFRPDRFLGSKTFAPESLTDTLHIPISTDTVLDRIKNGTKLRVGLRLVARPGFDIRVGSATGGLAVALRIKASKDTAATPVIVSPISLTPLNQLFLSGPLSDFSILVKGVVPGDPTLLSVGGPPARRTFLRFNIPAHIIDSTTIVRASLLLTQAPNRFVDTKDSVRVFPVAILSSPTVTDVSSLLQFIGNAGEFGLDSLSLVPNDSGVRSFEIVGLTRLWKQQSATSAQRAIALLSGFEAQRPGQIDFYSTRAPVGLRPRLRITYVPASNFGLP